MTTRRLATLEGIRLGETASCELVVTSQHIEAFAAFSQDDNSLHMKAEFARDLGFTDRVAHGMIAMSMLSRIIGTQLPGDGALWLSQEVQFTEAVMPGDHLKATVSVEKISAAARSVLLKTEVCNLGNGKLVLRGRAGVRLPVPAPLVHSSDSASPVTAKG